ncbi:transcriptional regulator with HTH domain and aminotransferase domain [Desulfosporosinus orientis DSM 765]|uniref:Transcriptional regulator with HTH domain and aminotransferase domain n=1 Tax=Desulfosporosinus orientis (strain ATCC 19365 / DSM 765 / NCIMB 8382 / VKM B-1628 / Singapore I) TaxID=768706 RepID=G7WC11_DESOD|nr:PLP-dependent aminotransferase family protein [Desulfosporosinus orientis]AET69985.1 transcriptional regulator with HTH domain and aminotransferase domain [Desulfosporosinus orientis DSM 765]
MQYAYAERVQNMENSAIRELLKVAEQPHIISFAGGLPAPELFPLTELKESYQKVLGAGDPSVLQYGSTEGYLPLRAEISALMKEKGISSNPENILLTNGSQQGLDLIAKLFINPGDIVLLQNPSYLGAIQSFQSYQANFITIPTNSAGIDYTALELLIKVKRPKLFYLTPTFQNPTGSTLTVEERKTLLNIARQYHLLIIEDDPYSELCYDNTTVSPIRAFSDENEVIYLGTFSKTLAPGLRLGWIAAEKNIISKLTIAKQGTDLHTSTLLQRTTHYYLTHFKPAEHILSIRQVYKDRRDIMLKALEDHLTHQALWTEPRGGMFIWLTLPEVYDTLQLLPSALAGNVAYVPGANFYVNQKSSNSMRLNFSNPSPTQIEQGIKLLADIIKQSNK